MDGKIKKEKIIGEAIKKLKKTGDENKIKYAKELGIILFYIILVIY